MHYAHSLYLVWRAKAVALKRCLGQPVSGLYAIEANMIPNAGPEGSHSAARAARQDCDGLSHGICVRW